MNHPEWASQAVQEKADGYRQIWFQALRVDYTDARWELIRGVRCDEILGYPSALDDLTGTRRQLTRLCDPIGLDVGKVAEGMERLLHESLQKKAS